MQGLSNLFASTIVGSGGSQTYNGGCKEIANILLALRPCCSRSESSGWLGCFTARGTTGDTLISDLDTGLGQIWIIFGARTTIATLEGSPIIL